MPDQSSRHRTPALVVVAVVLVLEGLAVFSFGVLELTQFTLSSPALGVIGLMLVVYGVFVLFAARGIWLGQRWARAPSIVVQLIQLPIAWNLRGGPSAGLAAGLGLSALIAVVGLLLPSSTAVFNPPPDESTDSTDR